MHKMSLVDTFDESLCEEVKELLQNYKFKKASIYEPCTLKNFKECLIGLSEELGILNINYIFNPYTDFDNNVLQQEALVKLINAVWTVLHHYKNNTEKINKLMEQNSSLESNNKQLNVMVSRLRDKLNLEKNESKACVATAQRISEHSNDIVQKLSETHSKLNQLKKQKETKEKALCHEITRLKLENEKLLDRLRNKAGTFKPCSNVCDTTILQLNARDKKQRTVIAQLQANNQELLHEVLALKEDLLVGGLKDFKMKD